jgi:flagellar protein FlaJ
MTRRERIVYRLRIRYKVKRSYIVVGIPAVVAVLLFVYGIVSGFAFLPGISPPQSGLSSSANQRLSEYQQLINSENNGTSAKGNQTAIAPVVVKAPTNPHNLDLLVVVTMVVGLGPYSYDETRRGRMQRKYEEDFTDFLFELSELVRGGIDPIKATITLSEGNLGSITKQVKVVAKQMLIGYTFEQAMRNLSLSLRSPLIDKYIDLVIQASYSGGSVANLIQRASFDLGTFLSIEREKREGLAQYRVILYTGQVVLIGLCVVLVVMFLPSLADISTIGSTSLSSSILGSSDIASVPLERDLFYLVMISGFLGGLVIGKISEAKIVHGIKHGLILVVIAFIAWTIFVVPATSGAGVHYNYAIVSYDKQGYAALPLKDPIVVQVNDTSGNGVSGVVVSFAVSGGGSVIPSAVNTGVNGQATAQIILGTVPGIDSVSVTVNGNTTAVPVVALSGGS